MARKPKLTPGQPCPCCGQPVKWDRKAYMRELMRKRRAAKIKPPPAADH